MVGTLDTIHNTIGDISDIIGVIVIAITVIYTIVGFIKCFFGYKVFRITNALIGASIGAVIGAIIGAIITQCIPGIVICALISALFGGWISYKVYIIGVFINCYSLGLIIVTTLGAMIGFGTMIVGSFLVGNVVGLICGILGCIFTKSIIMLFTAIEGALYLSIGLLIMVRSPLMYIMSVFMFAVLGYTYQGGKSKEKNKDSVSEKIRSIKELEAQECTEISKDIDVIESEGINPKDEIRQEVIVNRHSKKLDNSGDNSRKLLREVFSINIYEEIKYALNLEDESKVIFVPYNKDDGKWLCCCGEESLENICRFCGINREDAIDKINYTYLRKHRIERLEKEKAERKRKLISIGNQTKHTIITGVEKLRDVWNGERVKKVRDKSRPVIDKAKKSCKTKAKKLYKKAKRKKKIVALLMILITIAVYIVQTPYCKCRYYTMKGALIVSRKPLVALSYYRKANELQDNADIRYNIIDAYYRLGKYADCNRELHEALDSFPESVKLDKFILKMKPDKPVFSLKSGEYEDVQVIEIYSKDTKDRI